MTSYDLVHGKTEAEVDFAAVNEGKTVFDDVYNAPDPRGYCATLSGLDYRIPAEAKPVFRSLIHALQADGLSTVHLADLGCSYGINAALLKYGMTLGDFFDRYTSPSADRFRPPEIVDREARFFSRHDEDGAIEIVGLDIADRALDFAESVGLLGETISENLEERPLSPAAAGVLRDTDLVISTGCVGYVTERTFRRILEASGDAPPRIASFVLRMFPYDAIEDALADYGLVTEKLPDVTFLQRRFEDRDEREHVFEQLRAQGIEPDLERDGYYHAEFYLSRPAAEAKARPLGYLV